MKEVLLLSTSQQLVLEDVLYCILHTFRWKMHFLWQWSQPEQGMKHKGICKSLQKENTHLYLSPKLLLHRENGHLCIQISDGLHSYIFLLHKSCFSQSHGCTHFLGGSFIAPSFKNVSLNHIEISHTHAWGDTTELRAHAWDSETTHSHRICTDKICCIYKT